MQDNNILFQTEWWHNTAGVICGAQEYIEGRKATYEKLIKVIDDTMALHIGVTTGSTAGVMHPMTPIGFATATIPSSGILSTTPTLFPPLQSFQMTLDFPMFFLTLSS